MNTFELTASSPDGNAFKGTVVKLTLRGHDGDLAIMAGHIPFVTTVKPCICRIETENGFEHLLRTDGGILTVSENKVTLLSGKLQLESE